VSAGFAAIRSWSALLARAAPRSLLAVSCPVSEYDRSPGMIGESQPG
jgi:hypothetical protein